MQFNHFNIKARFEDLLKVKYFYCQVFGLEDGYRPKYHKRGFWLYYNDDAVIHLVESEDCEPCEQPHLDHIAFSKSGLSNFVNKLNALKVEYKANYFEDLNLTQLFLIDPVGVRIEVDFKGESLND